VAAVKKRSIAQSVSALLLILIGVLIALPLIGAAEFSLRDGGRDKHSFKSYAWIFQQEDFITNAVTTLQITVVAVLVTFILMVPTVAWLHIYGKKYIKFVEVLTVLPLIIPVVALATGAALALPAWLQSTQYVLSMMYVVLAMPFTFRALDIGMRGVQLEILVAAGRNLGAPWRAVILKVITPVILPSIFAALFLTVALSLGEFTLAQLLHWTTFPTWVAVAAQGNILGATALSVGSLLTAWVLLFSFTFFDRKKTNHQEEE
jgi:putative spermidine/putrescine transport system permease protein